MKKILVIICILCLVLSISACKKTVPVNLEDNISYLETHLYFGESTKFSVSITMGKKENVFIADGASSDLVEFATLRVTPLKMELFDNEYTFSLTGENGEMNGALEKDIFGVSFSYELTDIATIGELMNITVIYGESEDCRDTIELTNMLKDMLDWEDVLEIAKVEFADMIASEMVEGNFPREIHIKYLNNRTLEDSPYYWYISFISTTSDYWALLLEPMSGAVVSKKS